MIMGPTAAAGGTATTATRGVIPLFGRRPARVLIVDDEPAIARALAIACERAGYEALSTTSGEQAQRLLERERVDVLVVDLRIPDVRGDVLFHLATAVQPHLARQTLFITGDVTPRAHALIGACGTPYLHKPFELSDVLQTIRALLPMSATATA